MGRANPGLVLYLVLLKSELTSIHNSLNSVVAWTRCSEVVGFVFVFGDRTEYRTSVIGILFVGGVIFECCVLERIYYVGNFLSGHCLATLFVSIIAFNDIREFICTKVVLAYKYNVLYKSHDS